MLHNFKDFKITTPNKGFEGDKIRIDKIFNKEIIVHDYKVEDSKLDNTTGKNSGKCLTLQIEVDRSKRIVFTGSLNLIAMLELIGRDRLPFKTTLSKENERFEFT